MNPDDQALADLRRNHPGHRIWRARRWDDLPGDWVATLHDPELGVSATVMGRTADELGAALTDERAQAAQKRIDAKGR